MEITVGICDDDARQLKLLRGYLGAHLGEDCLCVVESSDPAAFLEKAQKAPLHIAFLDVDMGTLDGIRLGEQLRELYPDLLIIYLTAYEKYALDAFRVRAFHYLVKPVSKEEFKEALKEAADVLRRRQHKEEPLFSLQVRGELVSFPYGAIDYFEKSGHRVKVHAGGRQVSYYGNLRELLETLGQGPFLQCHQGFVVNMDKVRSFRDKTLFLEGELSVPVSRTHVEAVREQLAARLFGGRGSD